MPHNETPDESPVITLNESKREQLEAKLREYKQRQKDYEPIDAYKPPESDPDWWDTTYKVEILERLLRDGSVVTWDLARELENKYKRYNLDAWETAAGVIDAYNSGAKVRGGTGLPS